MVSKIKILLSSLVIFLAMFSCTMQKRLYRPGYYFSGNLKNISFKEERKEQNNLILKSNNESLLLAKKEELQVNGNKDLSNSAPAFNNSSSIILKTEATHGSANYSLVKKVSEKGRVKKIADEKSSDEKKQINMAFALTMLALLSVLLLVMVYLTVNATGPIIFLYVLHFASLFLGFIKAKRIKRDHKAEHVKGEHYEGKGKLNISLFFGNLYLLGLLACVLYGLLFFFLYVVWG